jgi:hypothetical protein
VIDQTIANSIARFAGSKKILTTYDPALRCATHWALCLRPPTRAWRLFFQKTLAKAVRKKFHFVIWLKPFFLLPSDHWLKPVAIEEKKRSTLLF